MAQSRLVLVGGPNGSGKSTFAKRLLPLLGIETYVNPDALQAALDGGQGLAARDRAGREAFALLDKLIHDKKEFAWETTLAGRGSGYLRRLELARRQSYQLFIHLLWLPQVDLCMERIRGRVAAGGHDIAVPEQKRRFSRVSENFLNLYRELADGWWVWDNSGSTPSLIASGSKLEALQVGNRRLWQEFCSVGGVPVEGLSSETGPSD